MFFAHVFARNQQELLESILSLVKVFPKDPPVRHLDFCYMIRGLGSLNNTSSKGGEFVVRLDGEVIREGYFIAIQVPVPWMVREELPKIR